MLDVYMPAAHTDSEENWNEGIDALIIKKYKSHTINPLILNIVLTTNKYQHYGILNNFKMCYIYLFIDE